MKKYALALLVAIAATIPLSFLSAQNESTDTATLGHQARAPFVAGTSPAMEIIGSTQTLLTPSTLKELQTTLGSLNLSSGAPLPATSIEVAPLMILYGDKASSDEYSKYAPLFRTALSVAINPTIENQPNTTKVGIGLRTVFIDKSDLLASDAWRTAATEISRKRLDIEKKLVNPAGRRQPTDEERIQLAELDNQLTSLAGSYAADDWLATAVMAATAFGADVSNDTAAFSLTTWKLWIDARFEIIPKVFGIVLEANNLVDIPSSNDKTTAAVQLKIGSNDIKLAADASVDRDWTASVWNSSINPNLSVRVSDKVFFNAGFPVQYSGTTKTWSTKFTWSLGATLIQ